MGRFLSFAGQARPSRVLTCQTPTTPVRGTRVELAIVALLAYPGAADRAGKVERGACVGGIGHDVSMSALTDDEKRMLDFEESWWKFAGAKEAAIRDRFDCSTTVYYQRLGALLERPGALEYAPMTVRRLVRLRDARRGVRRARGAS